MKTYLTGIKATHLTHLGNMVGAIKPAINFSEANRGSGDRFLYFIADYHSLTTVKKARDFNEYVYQVAATWLALGLDPENAVLYKQSDIPEIFELAWILACNTPKGDLNRAHAYKAIVQDNADAGRDPDKSVNAGLFNYPVLMAADILLFDTNIVPVGKDQVQHVEMARSMAQRINQNYGQTLVEPQEALAESGQYIPGLDGRKMSKSYENTIPLFVPEKKLKKLINKITSDSSGPDEPKSTHGSAIFDLYKCFSIKEEQDTFAKQFAEGISWGEAKAQLFEKVNAALVEPRAEFERLMNNRSEIDAVLKSGAEKARVIAQETMKRVRSNITGF